MALTAYRRMPEDARQLRRSFTPNINARRRSRGHERSHPTALAHGAQVRGAARPRSAEQRNSTLRDFGALPAEPVRYGADRERRSAQPGALRHDGAPGPLQETSLAGFGADVLFAPLAFRQALRRAGEARRRPGRARAVARRRDHRD